jgi:hypothetical protein
MKHRLKIERWPCVIASGAAISGASTRTVKVLMSEKYENVETESDCAPDERIPREQNSLSGQKPQCRKWIVKGEQRFISFNSLPQSCTALRLRTT